MFVYHLLKKTPNVFPSRLILHPKFLSFSFPIIQRTLQLNKILSNIMGIDLSPSSKAAYHIAVRPRSSDAEVRGRKSLSEESAVTGALADSDMVIRQAVELQRVLDNKHNVLISVGARNERLLSKLKRGWKGNSSFANACADDVALTTAFFRWRNYTVIECKMKRLL